MRFKWSHFACFLKWALFSLAKTRNRGAILAAKRMQNGSILHGFWMHFGCQKDTNWCSNGVKMGPKCTPNGGKKVTFWEVFRMVLGVAGNENDWNLLHRWSKLRVLVLWLNLVYICFEFRVAFLFFFLVFFHFLCKIWRKIIQQIINLYMTNA